MRKIFFFCCAVLLHMDTMAQPDTSFTYSGGGVFHRTFRQGGTVTIPYGSYIEYSLEQFYNDSLLADTKSNKLVMSIDSTMMLAAFLEPLIGLHVGDSVIYKVSVDSNMQMYAGLPWVRPGGYFISDLKIERVLTGKEEADALILKYQREAYIKDSVKKALLMGSDSKKIEEYLAQNNIRYSRTPIGVYISMTKKGMGKKITAKSILTVNYTGRTLRGTVFDSNTDSAFHHVTPLEVDLNNKGALIEGWENGLLYLNEGSRAMLYIPSPLGFGSQGSGTIGPNEITVFDIEVLYIKAGAIIPASKAIKPMATKRPKAKKQYRNNEQYRPAIR